MQENMKLYGTLMKTYRSVSLASGSRSCCLSRRKESAERLCAAARHSSRDARSKRRTTGMPIFVVGVHGAGVKRRPVKATCGGANSKRDALGEALTRLR